MLHSSSSFLPSTLQATCFSYGGFPDIAIPTLAHLVHHLRLLEDNDPFRFILEDSCNGVEDNGSMLSLGCYPTVVQPRHGYEVLPLGGQKGPKDWPKEAQTAPTTPPHRAELHSGE